MNDVHVWFGWRLCVVSLTSHDVIILPPEGICKQTGFIYDCVFTSPLCVSRRMIPYACHCFSFTCVSVGALNEFDKSKYWKLVMWVTREMFVCFRENQSGMSNGLGTNLGGMAEQLGSGTIPVQFPGSGNHRNLPPVFLRWWIFDRYRGYSCGSSKESPRSSANNLRRISQWGRLCELSLAPRLRPRSGRHLR